MWRGFAFITARFEVLQTSVVLLKGQRSWGQPVPFVASPAYEAQQYPSPVMRTTSEQKEERECRRSD